VTSRADINPAQMALLAELRQVTRKFVDSLAHQQALLDEEVRKIDEQHEQHLKVARREREKAAVVAGDACARTVRDAVAQLRDSAAMLPSDEDLPPPGEIRFARAVRLGDLRRAPGKGFNDEVQVPFLMPLLNAGNLVVESAAAQAGRDVVVTALFDAFARTTPGLLRLQIIDPTLSSCCAPFTALGGGGVEFAPRQAVDPSDITEALVQLTDIVGDVAQQLQGQWPSLAAFLEDVGIADPRPFHMLVVLDYPKGFDERSHDMLVRLAERGPQLGLSLLVHHDPSASPLREVRPEELLAHAEHLVLESGGTARWARVPTLAPLFRPVPPVETILDRCGRIAQAARTAARPTVELSTIVPPPDAVWSASSAERLIATVGKAGAATVTFTIGDEDDNLHNVLIGGSVGSGKSNLLLTLIYGLAARYSPEELELYLLDFKEGVEFARFARDGEFLPHARVVGIEADQELGKGVLEALTDEFKRRGDAFKAEGVQKLAKYREKTGVCLPRQLLIVDEFQVLLGGSGRTGSKNVELLEQLARKGRAYGIHILLSSQTLSGIENLDSKKNSIFGQFPVRIALKTNPAESQVILDSLNFGASQLEFRGQAVLNTNYGALASNKLVVVAWASDPSIEALDRTFAERRGHRKPPVVIKAGDFARPHAHFAAMQRRPRPRALLGESLVPGSPPAGCDLTGDANRHLVIGGMGSEGAVGMLQSAAVSLAIGLTDPASFIFVTSGNATIDGLLAVKELAAVVARGGHRTRIVSTADELDVAVTRSVMEMEQTSRRTIIIGAGLDELKLEEAGYLSSIVNVLQAAVINGHQDGVTLIGWWQRPAVMSAQLGNGWTANVNGRVLLNMDAGEAQSWTGDLSLTDWSATPARAGLVDTARDRQVRWFIPFGPIGGQRLLELQG
jgi:S-DNA-T family DNA segregation ATPase FtsK/SpoIIIE